MHFHDNTNSSPEAECCCSSSLSLARYSNFRQRPTWHSRSGDPSLIPLPSISKNNSIVIYSRGCWPLGQGRDESGSPFIFHLSPPATRRGWRHILRRGKPRNCTRGGDANFCQAFLFFFTIRELGAITRETLREEKKSASFFIENIGKFINKYNSNSFYLRSHLHFIYTGFSSTNSFNNTDI